MEKEKLLKNIRARLEFLRGKVSEKRYKILETRVSKLTLASPLHRFYKVMHGMTADENRLRREYEYERHGRRSYTVRFE